MKTQNISLHFSKKAVVELNQNQLYNIKAGTSIPPATLNVKTVPVDDFPKLTTDANTRF